MALHTVVTRKQECKGKIVWILSYISNHKVRETAECLYHQLEMGHVRAQTIEMKKTQKE